MRWDRTTRLLEKEELEEEQLLDDIAHQKKRAIVDDVDSISEEDDFEDSFGEVTPGQAGFWRGSRLAEEGFSMDGFDIE